MAGFVFIAPLALIVSALVQQTGPTTQRAAQSRTILLGCGSVGQQLIGLEDIAWRLPPDLGDKHHALRKQLGQPMPEAATRILVYLTGGHLETSEGSAVLTRDEDGSWRGSMVGQGRVWYVGSPLKAFPRQDWTLSARDGRRLDELLADDCLFAEPSSFYDGSTGPPPVSYAFANLDIAAGGRRHRAAFTLGGAKALTSELIDLALPK